MHHPKSSPKKISRWRAGPALFAVISTAVVAQDGDETVYQLSPFEVDGSGDTGYRANSTMTGGRLNSNLRDTAASVSVFTDEFLDDAGLDNLEEMTKYSVGSQRNTQDDISGSNVNNVINGKQAVKPIRIRGIESSQAIDYFASITPDDSYNVARWDEGRGPNGILFGISDAGGLVNRSTRRASVFEDSGEIQYSFGSYDRSRTELNFNKVLIGEKLAVAVSALDQENGGWREYQFDDKERIYGSITWKPTRKISLYATGESGRDRSATVRPFNFSDSFLAWKHNRDALGVGAVTFVPNNKNPNPGQRAVGVTDRNANDNGRNRRLAVIANDGTVFDSVGTFTTGSYNDPEVVSPSGEPGLSTALGQDGDLLRINDPENYPRYLNAVGPDMYRDQSLMNYTISLDAELMENLYLNIGHNYQKTKIDTPFISGKDPILYGDANTTLGVDGPANPYAGRLYFNADWRNDLHTADYKETRASLAYEFEGERIGFHRVAAALSRTNTSDFNNSRRFAVLGAPFHNNHVSSNNRISTRFYVNEDDPSTFHVGSYKDVPTQINVDGETYDTGWVNGSGAANFILVDQEIDSKIAVLQSHFFNRRLATTFGYREDDVEVFTWGTVGDDLVGAAIDPDPANGSTEYVAGITRSAGIVYHLNENLSLIANKSTSVGLPEFNRLVYPEAVIPDTRKGEGEDFGIGFNAFEGKVAGRLVYFTTDQELVTGAYNHGRQATEAIMDAYEDVLVGTVFSEEEWETIYAERTPQVNANYYDTGSEGYELSIQANPTKNWRLVFNASKTDRIRSNTFRNAIAYFGLVKNDEGRISQGVTIDTEGVYRITNPETYADDGAIAELIRLGSLHPDADPETLVIDDGTVAQRIFDVGQFISDDLWMNEQRWGLRPYKANVFTAYDFVEGGLKGFTIGGGYRWRSANIMGFDGDGNELKGRDESALDLMLRYSHRVQNGPLDGQMTYQVNVINALDEDGIVPQRFSTLDDPGYRIPGTGQLAYSRYDLVEPRSVRFTVGYSF